MKRVKCKVEHVEGGVMVNATALIEDGGSEIECNYKHKGLYYTVHLSYADAVKRGIVKHPVEYSTVSIGEERINLEV